jgi:hypothetical protein
MPKTKMDYSNTIIYKIFCKDPSIKKIYIGHTTNFVTRKSAHKSNCKNSNSYIYRYIRAHGEWDNWKIIILDDIDCKNYEEARKAEQSYIDEYNNELNSTNAYGVKDKEEKTEKEYNEKEYNEKEYNEKEYNEKEYNEKEYKKFNCECCSYSCSKKSDYDKHLATLKHKKTEMVMNGNELVNMGNEKVNTKFVCLCGKEYNYIQGLSRHKKNCNYQETESVEIQENAKLTETIIMLIHKNEAFQNTVSMMMEKLAEKDNTMMEKLAEKDEKLAEKDNTMMEKLAEKDEKLAEKDNTMMKKLAEKDEVIIKLTNKVIDMPAAITNSNSNNNTNNFNINMFLNEECKDAINMSDFIKSIQVSIDQLQYTTNNGLGKGITKVIMDNMNKLSKYERPLHCSDIKRETIYIKDDDKWEKDTHKDKLKKAINKTSNKNYTALCDWTRENPAFMKQDDKQHFYARTASTIGKPICDVEDKIIKSICKDNFIKE